MPATLVNMPRLIIIERFFDAMYIKRITWLSLLCAAILCLSSCGSAGTLPGKTDSAAEAADSASYRYVKTAIALPKENFIISNAEAAKSNIYLFGTEVTEAPNNYYIYALDYDGNIIDQKRCAWDDGYYHSIMDSAVDDSGTIWLLEYLYERTYDEDGNKTSERSAGWCVERVDENGFSGPLFSSSVVDEPWEIDVYNEAVYLCSSDGAFCFSVDGDFLGSSGSLNGFRGMTIAGGSIYLLHSDISGVKISLVSPEDCSISADLAADVNVYDLIGGTGLYINSGSDLYSFDPETGETGLVLNWVSAGVSGNYKGVTALADGAFLYYDARELCILEPAAHTDELITLTLASMEPRFIRDAVIDFNASNGKYAVEIIDYSQYNTDDAPEAGVLRLNLDIISGNAPDIIDLTSLPLGQYENMGLLEDLSAYFDREGSPAMAENLLNALKSGGKLCAIVPCCTIMTIEAYAQALPDEEDHSSETANMASGTQIYSFQTIGGAGGLFGAAEDFGCSLEDLQVCGLPFREGSGTLVPVVYLAIPASSKNVDAAFGFIKSLMLEENTLYKNLELNAFPILSAEYERLAEYEQQRIDAAEEGQYPWTYAKHYERAAEVLDGLNGLCCPDTALMGIVDDAVPAYFAGASDASKTADEIVSRLGIYFAEKEN